MKKKNGLMALKKKVSKHLKADIKTFKRESAEDKELMSALKRKKKSSSKKVAGSVKKGHSRKKIEKVMHEFKEGTLRSGSKKGPVVKKRKQAIAIAISEAKSRKKNK